MGTPLPRGFLAAHLILRVAGDTLKMQHPRPLPGPAGPDWTCGVGGRAGEVIRETCPSRENRVAGSKLENRQTWISRNKGPDRKHRFLGARTSGV